MTHASEGFEAEGGRGEQLQHALVSALPRVMVIRPTAHQLHSATRTRSNLSHQCGAESGSGKLRFNLIEQTYVSILAKKTTAITRSVCPRNDSMGRRKSALPRKVSVIRSTPRRPARSCSKCVMRRIDASAGSALLSSAAATSRALDKNAELAVKLDRQQSTRAMKSKSP